MEITSRVLCGTMLGLALFSILEKVVSSEVAKFGDDTKLFQVKAEE